MVLDYFIDNGITYDKFIERTPKNRDRLEKNYNSVIIPEKMRELIANISVRIRMLVFAENWCSDTVLTLPILVKLAELSENIDLLIVPRDDVMEEFNKYYLTEGKAKIPLILFLLDKTDEVHRWVERTKFVREEIKRIKATDMKRSKTYRSVIEFYLKESTIEQAAKDLACELLRAETIAISTMN
ncbi:MAG: thioredoxin family protein [Candidatus Heimdallarchaeaceae archaeon]